jgi:hypothetical protein
MRINEALALRYAAPAVEKEGQTPYRGPRRSRFRQDEMMRALDILDACFSGSP